MSIILLIASLVACYLCEGYILHARPEDEEKVMVPQLHAKVADELVTGDRFSQPLEIVLNMDNTLNDKYSCYKAGDKCTYESEPATACTCTEADVVNDEKRQLLWNITMRAAEFFKGILRIKPLVNNTLLVNATKMSGKACQEITIPQKYEKGIPNAGFLLMMTMRVNPNPLVIAQALFCQSDQWNIPPRSGRPTVGLMNVAVSYLDNRPENHRQLLGVIIHEITHALGFTVFKFRQGFIRWKHASGDDFEAIDSHDIIRSSVNSANRPVVKIITHNVVAAARQHYGCEGLDGAELEQLGGPSTALSHWSKMYFQNEIMTGISSAYPVFSNITLSLFSDMGWYGVNFGNKSPDVETSLVWGRNMGCNFADDCTNWPLTSADEGYRCDSTSPRVQCTFDNRGWAECNKGRETQLDDPRCNYYVPSTSSYCDNDLSFMQMALPAGEQFDNTSRCFHSSLAQLEGFMDMVPLLQLPYPKCYKTACQSSKKVKIGLDGEWYDCPYEGGYIYPQNYGGSIYCKPQLADDVCLYAPNDPAWPSFYRISPLSGKTGVGEASGTQVTVFGSSFNNGTRVFVGDVECADYVARDATSITLNLPPNAKYQLFRGLGIYSTRTSVRILNADGKSATAVGVFHLEFMSNGDSISPFFNKCGLQCKLFISTMVGVFGLLFVTCVIFYIWGLIKHYSKLKNFYRPKAELGMESHHELL